MYEHHLSKFKPIETDQPFYAIELLVPPYVGVKLFIGQTFIFENVEDDQNRDMSFEYDIFDPPEWFTEDHVTEEFHEVLKMVFLAILEQKMPSGEKV